jgi:hypothetical protein
MTDRMALRVSQGAAKLSVWNGNIVLVFQKVILLIPKEIRCFDFLFKM